MRKKERADMEKIGLKYYPKLKLLYAGVMDNFAHRKDLMVVNDPYAVKEVTKKCFGNHPEAKNFSGYIVNKKDACKEAYGFHYPEPFPTKPVYKMVRET